MEGMLGFGPAAAPIGASRPNNLADRVLRNMENNNKINFNQSATKGQDTQFAHLFLEGLKTNAAEMSNHGSVPGQTVDRTC